MHLVLLAIIFIGMLVNMFRYNFEEVLINSRYDLYGHSICCVVWSYFDYELFVGNFYCIHLDAPGISRQPF